MSGQYYDAPQHNILDNLIAIARLYWSEKETEDRLGSLQQTASNIDKIMKDAPLQEIEP